MWLLITSGNMAWCFICCFVLGFLDKRKKRKSWSVSCVVTLNETQKKWKGHLTGQRLLNKFKRATCKKIRQIRVKTLKSTIGQFAPSPSFPSRVHIPFSFSRQACQHPNH